MFFTYITSRWNRRTALAAVLLLALFAFYPSLENGFTNWDDGNYLLENPLVRSLAPANVAHIFTRLHSGLYKPLVIFSFAVEYHFFGYNPLVYHVVNLAFHLANCALVFFIVERLSVGFGVAFITALLFGIHPMHVESVAWVSERKDMLYSFFFLLSFWLYLRYRASGSKKGYWCAVCAFVLSLISKPFGVALPLLLLLTDWLQNRPRDRGFWLDKLPFFALAGALGGLAFFTVKSAGVLFDRTALCLLDKFQILSYSFLFYSAKALFPVGLSVVYPYPVRDASGAYPFEYAFAPLLLMVVLSAAFYLLRKNRVSLYGLLFFIVTLIPGLQWLPAAPSVAMDHYSYIPYIGFFMALSAPTLGWLENRSLALRRWGVLLFMVVLVGLVAQARARCAVWKDSCVLWSDMLEKYRKPVAYVNRAVCLIERGEYGAALSDIEKALALNPEHYLAYANRALVRYALGEKEKGLADLRRVVELAPEQWKMRYRLGAYLLEQGDTAGARRELLEAARLAPEEYSPHLLLGNIYLAQECPFKAVEEFETAVRLSAPPELGVSENVARLSAALRADGVTPGVCAE